ncbi:GNAT family N-acetyltransferase [Actinoplanes oblitus]|uniref:GNAT family N-acetyltransferase n=1 Tax=Actinoplanes oblitus TaxID=3040509 RepID=A0ABY8WRV0_9ACTN|nr:GNAT family N-acetyltransferase [Actinoplanes oblitus]WIN00571.1 GNAT family N-acetyltransferase [Actinoplanes oblitus]
MKPFLIHPVEVPPGYPSEYEREVRLAEGRVALIRPIVPADRLPLACAILSADADTLYRRFLGSPPPLTPALLTYLCTVDYQKRFALVAGDPRTEEGIAVARYEATGGASAEIAVAVDPRWRRIGLATALVEILAEAALDRGIHTFTASYLAENRPVAALLALLGSDRIEKIREGLAEAVVALDPASVSMAVKRLEADGPTTPS